MLHEEQREYLRGCGRPAQQGAAGAEYFLGDALSSVRQLVDENGEVNLARDYQPYGETLSSSGGGMSVYGFTGEAADPSGLVYLRARYYSPSTGRFLSRDPWDGDANMPMSYNAWLYGYANPINLTDPTGKYPIPIIYRPSTVCREPNPSERDPNAWTFLVKKDGQDYSTFIYCGEFKLTAYGFLQDTGYSGGINEIKVTSTDGRIELPKGLALDIQMQGTGYTTRPDVLKACKDRPYITKVNLNGSRFTYSCGAGKNFYPIENFIEKAAAADLNVIPLNSTIYLPEMCGTGMTNDCDSKPTGATIQVLDEGGRIKGSRLDIFAGMGPGENSTQRGNSPLYAWVRNHSYLGTTTTYDGSAAVGPTPVYQLVSDVVMEIILQSLQCRFY